MQFDVIELGPRVRGNNVTFRIWLPNMDPEARVLVTGSFCDWEPDRSAALRYDSKKQLWEGIIEDLPDGNYDYSFIIKTGTWYSNPSSDPYARMTGEKSHSAFKIPVEQPARLDRFYSAAVDELVLYELDLDNFNQNFQGVTKRVIYYLSQLGVNGIIFSPWVGFDRTLGGERIPVSFYAPDGRYGGPHDLKIMINECHKAGISVIMDIDLHAVSPSFGINQMYPVFENKPMLGRIDDTGKKIYLDYSSEYAREFAYSVCRWWLDEFKVDGFRFLNCKEYWDGKSGEKFSGLVSRLHAQRKKEGEEIFLFTADGSGVDSEIINTTCANGVTNGYFTKRIHRMAESRSLDAEFWKTLDLNQLNFSEETVLESGKIRNTALNSIEGSHTHSLTVKMGVISGQRDAHGYPVGDRKNHWWKVKPYIIAQFLAPGVPVIYNGQEIGNNRFLPDTPPDRFAPRPVMWQYLADFAGKDLFRFHQKLINLRNKFKSIKSRNFFHDFTDTERQIIVFKRYLDDESVIVAINFSNESHETLVQFPSNGIWHEHLDDYDITVQEKKAQVKIPARYGAVFYQI